MKTKWFVVLACAQLLAAVSADAAIVRWSFEAVVQDIEGSATGMAEYGVAPGTVVSGAFYVDDTSVGELINENVFFDEAVVGVELNVGTFSAVIDQDVTAFNLVIARNADFDAIAATARLVVDNTPGGTVGFAALDLLDADGLINDDDLFPELPGVSEIDPYTTAPPGSQFIFQATVGGTYTTARAEILFLEATVVPIPGAAVLMLSAMAGLAGLARRGATR